MRTTTIFLSALSALIAKSTAQVSADFVNMTWGNVTVGQLWPIYWSPGNGYSVSLSIGNGSYSSSIFTNVAATPGNYNWTVTVSPNFVAGYYSLALSQAGAGTSTSPAFYVAVDSSVPPPPNGGPTVTSTTTLAPTTTNITLPTVTVIWYEEACGCTQTSTCNTIPLPTATNGTYIATTYYEEACGCSKTAYPVAPASAAATIAPAANNYTMPAPTAAASPVASPAQASPLSPATFPGAAVKVSSAAGFGLFALVAVAAFAL